MKFSKIAFVLLMLLGAFAAGAQALDPWGVFASEPAHVEYAGIVFQGKVLTNPARSLQILPDAKGRLNISSIKREAGEAVPVQAIGFRVGIEDYHTSTLWMFSGEVFREIDVSELLKWCKLGDKLVFMTVDRRYRLSKHEIVVMDGC